ncbi:ARM repeat-containing protein [Delitschia confertaspora ATCC 74209]|uniref:ARM repeat-containing protein n=1 Tax=Delitschia confertaspora ATCC 74209 TaxID=1513339 RepID=A0A9P4JVF2_9PLEO|nr:ARM repeat-containing protein [Delitschia confertaspora ATCC 74209]
MASEPTPEARELSLVGKLEMRIALADSDKKLQDLLKTYLAPLLLKLASEHVAVRNKVISVCQHINTRIKPQEIKLPVTALLKQFKENPDVPLIRHFDILYIQQGISRLPVSDRLELFPILIRGISVDYSKSALHASQLFHLLLRILGHFKLPLRGSKEDDELRASLSLDATDAKFLSDWFGKLLLLTIVRTRTSESSAPLTCPGLSTEEYRFLTVQGKPEAWDPTSDSGLNLAETKIIVTKFLTSGLFTDEEKFFPALFASADTNSRISDVGEDILKRLLMGKNLDDPALIETLFDIYFGLSIDGGNPPVKVPLKIKILTILSKSVTVAVYPKLVSRLVEEGLLNQHEGMAVARISTGREASKFRSAVFALVNWVARQGAAKGLSEVAVGLVENLKLFIQDQGWPCPERDEDLELRGYGYETIGLLAKAAPEKLLLGSPSLGLLEWLFRSLREDSSGQQVAVSMEEALSTVMNAFTVELEDHTFSDLQQLLLQYASLGSSQSVVRGATKFLRDTRYVATRFANHCLPFMNPQGRWINILAVSGGSKERHEVVEEGRKGLDPYWHRMKSPAPVFQMAEPRGFFPRFADVVNFIFKQPEDGKEDVDMDASSEDATWRVHRFKQWYPDAFPIAVTFCTRIFMQEALQSFEETRDLVVEPTADWDRKLETLVSTSQRARQAIRAFALNLEHEAPERMEALETLLRAAFYRLVQDESSDGVFVGLCSLSPDTVWDRTGILADFRCLESSILSNDMARRTEASHSYGLLASHNQCDGDKVSESVSLLFDKARAGKTAVGGAVNQASGALLALSYYFSRVFWRLDQRNLPRQHIGDLLEILFHILQTSRDSTLMEAVYLSIEQLSLFHLLSVSQVSQYTGFREAVDKIYDSAKSGNIKAIQALGHFSMITDEPAEREPEDSSEHKYVWDKLYELHEVRQPEVQFSVGEAMSCFACGWDSGALSAALDIPHPKQTFEPWFTPMRTPDGPKREKTLAIVLGRTLAGCRNTKPALKKASVVWLLCLLQYCGHRPEIQELLPQCQTAFKLCLLDRDEVVQEAASRGLGLVYEKGGRQLQDELVRDLISSFSDNKSKMSGTITEDTQLFEPGLLPTGEGSVSTYKDILSLASEVGDTSLVYRFMSLAANNSIWSSRAAFGRFGLSYIFSNSSAAGYLAENPKLYSKLFRYRFDPNPNVQRAMNDIWNALVKDSSITIDKHFDAIMDDLLNSILTKEWRVRQASCAAIADLVQGRSIDKYEKYLSQVWDRTFKVLDDIKQSVRTAAASLARVLTGILTHSLEAGDSSKRTADAMLSRVLPFLFSTSGLESNAEEVRLFALQTLLQIIKKSGAKTLRPHIPELVEKLLGLLSALEPEAVNYIHLNASKYNLTEQKIDDMRLQNVRSSPLTESIERCLDLVDDKTMKALIPRIEAAIKSAVGLPSKVGCARLLMTLSTRHSFQFKPYADGFLKLIEKHVRDRNDTVSSSYGASAGYIARLASDKQLLSTIRFCNRLYFEFEDDKARLAAGDILLSISKHAADRFNSLQVSLLPFVFLAKHDGHEQVKKLFEETWSDNVSGSRAVLLYLKEIVTLADKYLDSQKWALKHAAARTVADAVMSVTPNASDEVFGPNAEIIWPVLDKALSGKTWEGKEVVLGAFVRFVERGKSFWNENKAVAKQIEKVAVREAKRQNMVYRPFALDALAKVTHAMKDLELSQTVENIVEGILDELIPSEGDDGEKMDVDGGEPFKDPVL